MPTRYDKLQRKAHARLLILDLPAELDAALMDKPVRPAAPR